MLKKQYVKSRNVCKVTFVLAKSELPEGAQGKSVYLVGDFNDWDTNATPMKRIKGGAFRTMLELEPGKEYQFRYLVDDEYWCNDWSADAYVPSGIREENSVVVTLSGKDSPAK